MIMMTLVIQMMMLCGATFLNDHDDDFDGENYDDPGLPNCLGGMGPLRNHNEILGWVGEKLICNIHPVCV